MWTPTSLLAAAEDILLTAGYDRVESAKLGDAKRDDRRAFEDDFGIVLVTVWPTWDLLREGWSGAQGMLVELMSKHILRSSAKAWEGYLVLLTPASVPTDSQVELDRIRYDTTYARKIVGESDDLGSIADLQRILSPLLPLAPTSLAGGGEPAIEDLRAFVADGGVEIELVDDVLDAFAAGQSLMSAISEHLEEQDR